MNTAPQPTTITTGFASELPISRYYLERFLQENADKIHDDVLDFGKKEYSEICNNLATGQGIPEAKYDCFILSQTLPPARDIKNVLKNCIALLKPGGHLLFSTGGIYPRSVFNHETWGAYWTQTSTVLKELFAELVPRENIKINTHGNIYSAACYLYGSVPSSMTKDTFDTADPDYLFLVTAVVKKA
jgi:SAM-dependent methyltransferase